MKISDDIKEMGYSVGRLVLSVSVAATNRRVTHYLDRCPAGIATEGGERTIRVAHGLRLYDASFAADLVKDIRFLCPSDPICLIPESRQLGELADVELTEGGLQSSFLENLTYQIRQGHVDGLLRARGIESFVGRAGDVLFFDSMFVHGSFRNKLNRDRSILIITYNNAVSNHPRIPPAVLRPDFPCLRTYAPLQSCIETILSFRDNEEKLQ